MRSYTELLQATKAVETVAAAMTLLALYEEEISRQYPEMTDAQVVKCAKNNVGYTFGEGMSASVRNLWEQLGVHHPMIDPWTDDPEVLERIGRMWAQYNGSRDGDRPPSD